MNSEFQTISKDMEAKLGSVHYCELSLTNIRDYKKFLMEKAIEDTMNILTMHLPRFLWIIRLFENDIPLSDGIYDATSVYVKQLADCEFRGRDKR
jgi:hypothetical protein